MLNNYRVMIERGIDVIEILIRAARRYGAQVWLSVRMNDHHFPDDPGFNSMLSYTRADELGVNGSRTYMDYSHPAVRRYYMAYLLELCRKYDIDGLELDFLRSAPLLSDPGPQGQLILNRFLRDVKTEISAASSGRVRLSARIYSTPEHNLSFGIDAAQWIADGSLDSLTVSSFYIPTFFSIPIDQWRMQIDKRNTANHPYSILAGTDWAVRCDSRDGIGCLVWLTLEQLRGFASSAYHRSADGIYFFNHFSTDNTYGAVCFYMDERGDLVPRNVLRDKFFAAASRKASESGLRSYVNTCRTFYNDLYPIWLSAGDTFTAVINTGSRFDSGTYCIILGLDEGSDAPEVYINGIAADRGVPLDKPNGSGVLALEGNMPVARHISEVAPIVLRYDLQVLDTVRDGDNTLRLALSGNADHASVKWVEIQACSQDTPLR